jgi:hypothetical protein
LFTFLRGCTKIGRGMEDKKEERTAEGRKAVKKDYTIEILYNLHKCDLQNLEYLLASS